MGFTCQQSGAGHGGENTACGFSPIHAYHCFLMVHKGAKHAVWLAFRCERHAYYGIYLSAVRYQSQRLRIAARLRCRQSVTGDQAANSRKKPPSVRRGPGGRGWRHLPGRERLHPSFASWIPRPAKPRRLYDALSGTFPVSTPTITKRRVAFSVHDLTREKTKN